MYMKYISNEQSIKDINDICMYNLYVEFFIEFICFVDIYR